MRDGGGNSYKLQTTFEISGALIHQGLANMRRRRMNPRRNCSKSSPIANVNRCSKGGIGCPPCRPSSIELATTHETSTTRIRDDMAVHLRTRRARLHGASGADDFLRREPHHDHVWRLV